MKKLSNDTTNTLDSNKTFTHLSTMVKELLENSIDAKAKNISMTISEGGISLIEVKDDGVGIDKDNLLLLCQRFSSTKIDKYSDLSTIDTFGFRGEALSILSYISTLVIISRTENSQLGYEAQFRNGKLIAGDLKAVPCEIGTIIKVENVFYNNLVRRNAYDKTAEAEDIISLVSKFAFHFIQISFCLSTNKALNRVLFTKRDSDNLSELEIRKKLCVKLFKQQVNDDLFKFDSEMKDINAINLSNHNVRFECYYTKPSASISKSKLILFVNNRLMQNSQLNRLFDQTYGKFLIKKGNYFAYLSMTCPNEMIDFNVAANKSQIFFSKEEEIFGCLENLLEEQLKEEINSKNYYMSQYSGFTKERDESLMFAEKKNVYDKDKVRIDANTVSIERYLTLKQIKNCNKPTGMFHSKDDEGGDDIAMANSCLDSNVNVLITIYNELFNEANINQTITEIIKGHYYVGYERKNNAVFIQFNTSLYLLHLKALLEEYFLYLLISCDQEAASFTETIKLSSHFKIIDLFKFISDHFPNKNAMIASLYPSLKDITSFVSEDLEMLLCGLMEIDADCQIQRMKVLNLFNSKAFISNFISYIPLIYFSLIEDWFQPASKSEKTFQQNTHLNFVVDSYKIYCHYLAVAYIEYLEKEDVSFANRFIRDVVLFGVKQSAFFFRKNVKEDCMEKIVDTETLYTVFERC